MKRKKCRFCGSNAGVYRIDKRFTLKAIILSFAIVLAAVLGMLESKPFLPLGIALLLTAVICLVVIKTPQYFCRACGERRH